MYAIDPWGEAGATCNLELRDTPIFEDGTAILDSSIGAPVDVKHQVHLRLRETSIRLLQ